MNEPIAVYFADLTYVHQGIQSEIIPHAIGSVAAFAKARLQERLAVSIFKRPDNLVAALKTKQPMIVAFSNYAWNHRLAYGFAEAIKAVHPEVATIFGGPNYPLDRPCQEEFLRAHPAVDFFVVKEGEAAFADLVERLLDTGCDLGADYDLPSVHYLHKESGDARLNEVGPRLKNLADIPSPYLLGWLDEFFDDGFMPIIQTNRGCPFSCTFCVEGSPYYQKVYCSSGEKVRQEIEYIAERMKGVVARGGRADLFIADSNFGMYKQDIETCKIIRATQERYNWPQYISVATGKNQKERVLEAARLVQGAIRLSGSVQSLDAQVLENIKCANVDANHLMALAIEGSDIGANTYSEIILGLPGDSRAKYEKTVSELIEMGFNKVETYTLMLLPGSEMDSEETRCQFDLVTKYRIIPRCFGYFDYEDQNICVGEIEEVVVGNNTLPFDDYLICREIALLVVLFYNDGIFEPAMRLLKRLRVPIMNVIRDIHDHLADPAIVKILRGFSEETRNELWDSREGLAQFISKRENVERYIGGELGSNLIFKYKSIAMLTEMPVLAHCLAAAMKRVIGNHMGGLNNAQKRFIDELTNSCSARGSHIFNDFESACVIEVHYDLDRVIDEGRFTELEDIGNDEAGRLIEYFLDEEQRGTIRRLINTYGNHLPGLTRGLTRTNIKRLLRRERPLLDKLAQQKARDSTGEKLIERP